MRALAKYIRNNRQVQLSLDMCTCPQHRLANSVQWQKFLNGRHEHLVKHSCCSKVPHHQLAIGIGSGFKIPQLIPWKCVWNNCGNCGIENKLKMLECGVLTNDEHVIDVMEWVDAPRQGFKKNGQQNTQLELGLSKCAVKDVVIKLVKSLEINRLHQAEYEWRNWMRKIDLTNSHPDIHRIIYTDFGATLDLSAIEKDNCSVNNHAVVCILFVVTN